MNIKSSLLNIVSRVVITGIDTARKCQTVGVKMLAASTKENVEHLEPYGFTSAAQNGAEGVILFPGGDRSHGVALAVADRRYRLKGLKAGEVAIYTDEGDSVVLKRGKIIEMTTDQLIVNASQKITLNTPVVEMSGNVTAAGDVSDGKGSMAKIRADFNGHVHIDSTGGTTNKPSQPMG